MTAAAPSSVGLPASSLLERGLRRPSRPTLLDEVVGQMHQRNHHITVLRTMADDKELMIAMYGPMELEDRVTQECFTNIIRILR